jgi:creatinine amidohydrolase
LKTRLCATPVFVGLLVALSGSAAPAHAQGRSCGPRPLDPNNVIPGAGSVYNCPDTPNPLAPNSSVWTEEMTWMDVRDAIAGGKTTVIVSTGGMEPNGPFLVTGKHNYVLHANCEAIARKLGNALCAPVLPFVPEGSIDPPSSHMRSPGTISARVETFEAVLTDIATSYKSHGFKTIVFIGDSGNNQRPQRAVAVRLTEAWGGDAIVTHVQEYYDYSSVQEYLENDLGSPWGEPDGLHDQPEITLNMFVDDPSSIRWQERVDAGLATINGVDLSNRVRTLELARALVDFRAQKTVAAINAAIENGGTIPAPPRPQRTGGAGGRGRFQRPEPDPRTMGGGECRNNEYNCVDTPNPLPEASTVWIEEMTWMDVRDALAAGKRTAIIPTGGIEENGPWLTTGKHNYVLDANCESLARELGDALCAPIVKWVPEGNPATLDDPGTISLRQETFRALLTDIAGSLKAHGFENIVFIGDSGGNRRGMAAVAERLDAEWAGEARAIHAEEYYLVSLDPANGVLVTKGLVTEDHEGKEGLHDNPTITLNMMASDPASVRWRARVQSGHASIDGFDISDLAGSIQLGREISQARAERTAAAIRARLAGM